MRIEHGAPFLNPERTRVQKEEPRKRSDPASRASGSRDRVHISREGRDLQQARAERAERSPDATAGTDARLERVRERIDRGFYDSPGVEESLTEAILDLYGL